ncbi:MAG TPA: response regulator [Stellaceae bacterium]|nr:response regulator [Stellaceae bacterium]
MPSARPLKGAPILGVDDDIDALIVLQTHLDSAGFTFFGATSGEEALKLARRVAPRLIILDVMMRGLDGFEICRRLRLDPAQAGVPILLLTARKTEADVLQAKAAGADDFIVKPFDAAQLAGRVRHWLDRDRRR